MAKRKKDAAVPSDRPVVRRERSKLKLAVAALEQAQGRRPALAAKVRQLHEASENLTRLDAEIAQRQQAVVTAMGDAQATIETGMAVDRELGDGLVGG